MGTAVHIALTEIVHERNYRPCFAGFRAFPATQVVQMS